MAGLSVLAHTHTPPTWLTSRWQANHCHHSSGHCILSTTVLKLSRTSDYCASSPFPVHFFFLTHRLLTRWVSHSQREEPPPPSFAFSHRGVECVPICILEFGVSLLSHTKFYVVVTHAASWELFDHDHPRFSCGDPFLHSGTVC